MKYERCRLSNINRMAFCPVLGPGFVAFPAVFSFFF